MFFLPTIVKADSQIGTLNVVWGDAGNGGSTISYSLSLEGSNRVIDLQIGEEVVVEAGGIRNIKGRSVVIETATDIAPPSNGNSIPPPTVVTSITLLDNESSNAASGLPGVSGAPENRRYVSIMCKFSDVPNEPQNLAFFSDMYGNAIGELNHYWNEVTSGQINVLGSTAHGWYTLPYTRAYYTGLISGSNYSTMLNALFSDCTSAADADVDFSTIFGINMMFNETFGDFAWGGGMYATLDGVSKAFASTWEPPWGWANVSVMAHEMGHSFGLPHSNNSDGDNSPYDNPWSVMSDTWSYTNYDPAGIYGVIAQHINAYDKLELGAFTAGEIFTHQGPFSTLILDPASDFVASSSAYRVAVIPVNSATIDYYTVEVRDDNSSSASIYEGLPGSGVIIHAVKNSRNEPAWLIDADTPAGGYGDTPGVIWTAGEVFEDVTHGVRVAVDSKIGESFQISLGYPSPELTSPTVGSTLAGSSETFQWTAASGATSYRVWLGSAAGGDDYGRFASTSTSVTVSGLPTDGSTVYATLKWYDGIWHTEATVSYTAFNATSGAAITSPVAGSTLAGTSETFQWTAASGATSYRVWLGSAAGGDNYGRFASNTTSVTVSGLPTNGSTVYATLKWYDGSWHTESSVSYTAFSATSGPVITTPVSGSTLAGTVETFQWTAASGATSYRIWLGSVAGSDDYGRFASTTTSVTVSGLPTDGSTIYATLKWNDGVWHSEPSVSYTAAANASVFTSPLAGSTISGGASAFQWNAIAGATTYRVWVGSTFGGDEFGRYGTPGSSLIATGIPTNGSTIYVTLKWNDGLWHTEPSVSYNTGP